MTSAQISRLVESQREFFRGGETLNINWRVSQLKKLKAAVLARQERIQQALSEDLSRSDAEGYLCDILPTLMEIDETIRGLKKWARPERRFSGFACFPSLVTRVNKLPYGVCLIISPFNFPFLLSLGVLTAAIAGGNTAVLKLSSKSRASTRLLMELIGETFPPCYVAAVDGGHDAADLCLEQRFDKIFYTGSPKVAAHVMRKAAENLCPVAFELGGENGNWCILRKDADLKDAARKIAFMKIMNAGQVCININQLALAEEAAEEFIPLLKAELLRQAGPRPQENPDYPRLISPQAYERCAAIAEEHRDRVIFGGEGDPETGKFAPTLIYPASLDEELVQAELFNPILPIVPYKDSEIEELIRTIESREHGLALYIFTADTAWAKAAMARMQFGGGCVNDVVMHLMARGAPFNGTGHSGMGAYHGKWGFQEFTHPQTVLIGRSRFNLPLREQPYGGKAGKKKLKTLKLISRLPF